MKDKAICQFTPAEVIAHHEAFYREMWKELAKHCKAVDPFSTETCFNVAQAFTLLEDVITDPALKTGLTLPGINVLTILANYKEAGCPLHELSHLLVVSRANITGLVDSLVRKGLVSRKEHPKDRRITLARLTPKGKKLIESYYPIHYGTMRKAGMILSHQEKETLIRLLSKLRHGLLELRGNVKIS